MQDSLLTMAPACSQHRPAGRSSANVHCWNSEGGDHHHYLGLVLRRRAYTLEYHWGGNYNMWCVTGPSFGRPSDTTNPRPGIALFTYHKYRKSIESTVPLDAHGNPVELDEDTEGGGYLELHQTDRVNVSMLRAESEAVSQFIWFCSQIPDEHLRILNRHTQIIKSSSPPTKTERRTLRSIGAYGLRKLGGREAREVKPSREKLWSQGQRKGPDRCDRRRESTSAFHFNAQADSYDWQRHCFTL